MRLTAEQRRIRDGLCVDCESSSLVVGKIRCEPCLVRQRRHSLACQQRKLSKGLCPYHGKPLLPGRLRTCSVCQEKREARQRWAQARRAELRANPLLAETIRLNREQIESIPVGSGERVCVICGQIKPLKSFPPYKTNSGARRRLQVCVQCGLDCKNGLRMPLARSGESHPSWKGDTAKRGTGHARARNTYQLGPCERCGKPGVDRHHKDGNTLNNDSGNVEVLCRRCHMATDGRLEQLSRMGSFTKNCMLTPAKKCHNCKRLWKPLRKGRCPACDSYFRKYKTERTPEAVAFWHRNHKTTWNREQSSAKFNHMTTVAEAIAKARETLERWVAFSAWVEAAPVVE